jgi:hypothetical protein
MLRGRGVSHHLPVSRSLRSDPRRLRARRRGSLPAIRTRPPAPGRHHPAPAASAPLRLVASIALAEIAPQVGRPPGIRPVPAPRRPAYERDIKLVADGELLILGPDVLLSY